MTTIEPKGHQGGSIALFNSSVNMEVESSNELLTILRTLSTTKNRILFQFNRRLAEYYFLEQTIRQYGQTTSFDKLHA